jgi:soluble lytic murein transglycosylase-like protein
MKSLHSVWARAGIIALVAMMTLPCLASEVAVLKNGFSIQHERREVKGDVTRLYVKADGSNYVDVPTAEIDHFEAAPEATASADKHLAEFAKSGASIQHPASNSPSLAQNAKGGGPAYGFSMVPSPFARRDQNTPSGLDLDGVINTASGRYRLDPDLVNSVIKAESGFNVRAVSPKGAQGLMQLMPGTASELRVRNVFDPQANVEGGTKYLRELLERYNFDLVKALAAYNAGPQRVEQFGGVPPYHETRAYVARVVKDFNKKKVAQKAAATPAQKAASGKPTGAKPPGAKNNAHSAGTVNQAKGAAGSANQ